MSREDIIFEKIEEYYPDLVIPKTGDTKAVIDWDDEKQFFSVSIVSGNRHICYLLVDQDWEDWKYWK